MDRNSRREGVFIAKKDFDIIYEGVFMRSVTSFESFIEELFIGLLYNKYDLNARHTAQNVIFNSRKQALQNILNGKKYLDLLPHDNLKKYSSIFQCKKSLQ